MDPTTLATTADAAAYVSESPQRGPVLVATDARMTSDAALVIGSALGARAGAPICVLSVVDAPLLPAGEASVCPDPSHDEHVRRADRLHAVREQVRKAIGERARCQVDIRTGSPARTIARVAAECEARLIVVGLGRHRIRDRLAGRETALQLTRIADVPVLAVPADMTDFPRRAVLATDFSDFSTRAARLAMEVLEDDAIVYLAHVAPRHGSMIPGWETWSADADAALATSFASLTASLAVAPDAVIEPVTLRGDAADEVLEFAEATGADLIAAGSHGHGFFERLVVGSVTTKIVRGAHCAVLVVPPDRR